MQKADVHDHDVMRVTDNLRDAPWIIRIPDRNVTSISNAKDQSVSHPRFATPNPMVNRSVRKGRRTPLYAVYAYTINNRGEIAVNGIDANGIKQAAVLVPCDENHAGVEGCDHSMLDAATAAQSPAPRYPNGAQRFDPAAADQSVAYSHRTTEPIAPAK